MRTKGLHVITGLAFLVLILFAMPVSAQKPAVSRPAEDSSPKVSVEDLEALASTIENDQTRQQLLDKIRASVGEPENAWLKIKRGRTWYYIAEDDLTSRVSSTILRALFSSVVGEVPGSKPLLTLPVE